jgi:hypothetical protein
MHKKRQYIKRAKDKEIYTSKPRASKYKSKNRGARKNRQL